MTRHIVACGGGGWSGEPGGGPLEDYILGLARTDSPSVCLLATASGDSDWVIARFHEFFGRLPCRASHIALFRAHPEGVAEHLMAQDVIYVAGGSSANLMAVWDVHGVGADPAARLGVGRRDVRGQRRRHLLVRRRPHQLGRPRVRPGPRARDRRRAASAPTPTPTPTASRPSAS